MTVETPALAVQSVPQKSGPRCGNSRPHGNGNEVPMRDVPYGYCLCGCGERTKLSKCTRTDRGDVRGQPVKYVKGHVGRVNPRVRLHLRSDYVVEDRGHTTPCWIWGHGLSYGTGYGYVGVKGRTVGAHRWYYEHHVGPIPAGLHLDHLCRVRACVNPAHLEPVTNAENARRGSKTRLTNDDIAAIRRSSLNVTELAIAYGLNSGHVSRIQRGLNGDPSIAPEAIRGKRHPADALDRRWKKWSA